MTTSRRFVNAVAWGTLVALVLVFTATAAPLIASPNAETHAYYSVVRDKPYAPYTTATDLQRTSTYAYYSVVRDKPYSSYTTASEFKRTSTVAYYSVLH